MRVVSMVPSWTETLLFCGADVVGRTRFCVHPQGQIEQVPILGGTKNIDLDRLFDTQVDLLLMDRQENTLEMSQSTPVAQVSSDIRSISDVTFFLRDLSQLFLQHRVRDHLLRLADRWEAVGKLKAVTPLWKLPVAKWLTNVPQEAAIDTVVYLIWRNPWMAASGDTFIGSVIHKLGLSCEQLVTENAQLYPTLQLNDFNLNRTLFLLSSEPYPFDKKQHELKSVGFKYAAIVDGESYSWFGLRTLQFLENHIRSNVQLDV